MAGRVGLQASNVRRCIPEGADPDMATRKPTRSKAKQGTSKAKAAARSRRAARGARSPGAKLLAALDRALVEQADDFAAAWPRVATLRDQLAKPKYAALRAQVRRRMFETETDYLVWACVLAGMAGADALPDLIRLAAAGEPDNNLNAVLFDVFEAAPSRARAALDAAAASPNQRVVAFVTYARAFVPGAGSRDR